MGTFSAQIAHVDRETRFLLRVNEKKVRVAIYFSLRLHLVVSSFARAQG